jgi:hypothetical protein
LPERLGQNLFLFALLLAVMSSIMRSLLDFVTNAHGKWNIGIKNICGGPPAADRWRFDQDGTPASGAGRTGKLTVLTEATWCDGSTGGLPAVRCSSRMFVCKAKQTGTV